ncbi:hypothetical protein CXB51_005294 [Gossypium anomalum]|uniref:Uncharacterized protein n=1 Tax=Gossypium anomalum TaxID=47600 RepID=A0A8J5ZW82_9ROSI|nr:hypothetical protein CXB51_005294 [Gossypium anomalum]
MDEGIVPGGGATYIHLSELITGLNFAHSKVIATNACVDREVVVEKARKLN